MQQTRLEAGAPSGAVAADFAGTPGAFFRLILVGGVLQYLTLGFYRFWLVTDIRRHLWGHTRIGSDGFEYTGTGRELLIGFLFALAILAPFYVLYFIAGLIAEGRQQFASVPLVGVLYVFGRYAGYRARRYRLTRTAFRGLRFWMSGSAWAYAARAVGWDVLTVLTLGLALPWRAAALEGYKLRNTYYGDLPGRFVASGWELFVRGFGLWLLLLIALAGFAFFFGLQLAGQFGFNVRSTLGLSARLIANETRIFGVVLVVLPLVVLPLFQARYTRWWIGGIRFGAVSTESALRAGRVFGCYVKAVVIAILFVLAALLLLGGGAYLFAGNPKAADFQSVRMQLGAFLVLIPFYLAVLVGLGIIWRQAVTRGIWVATAQSTTVHGLSTLDGVVARGMPASSVGEGLADALDVGAV